jgi:hypothetical protein
VGEWVIGANFQIIAKLTTLGKQKHVPAYQFAIAYAGVGDNDQVVRWLEKAYEERSDFLVVLRVEPLFDPFRSDQGFQDLQHRIGLPP